MWTRRGEAVGRERPMWAALERRLSTALTTAAADLTGVERFLSAAATSIDLEVSDVRFRAGAVQRA
jgi:hypothetical protein